MQKDREEKDYGIKIVVRGQVGYFCNSTIPFKIILPARLMRMMIGCGEISFRFTIEIP